MYKILWNTYSGYGNFISTTDYVDMNGQTQTFNTFEDALQYIALNITDFYGTDFRISQ